MRKGFTLLELIIVIIIIGILATLGFTQYSKMIEKGRMAEANSVLGNIRTMEKAYELEHGTWGDLAAVGLGDLPAGNCSSKYFFQYGVNTGAGTATANRCTGSGKTPNIKAGGAYNITVDFENGTLQGGP